VARDLTLPQSERFLLDCMGMMRSGEYDWDQGMYEKLQETLAAVQQALKPKEQSTMKTMVWGIEGQRMAAEAKSRAAEERRLRKGHPAAGSAHVEPHVRTLEQPNPASDQDEVIASMRPSRLPVSQHPAFARRF
jgi:hypothetical protein